MSALRGSCGAQTGSKDTLQGVEVEGGRSSYSMEKTPQQAGSLPRIDTHTR